MRFRRPSKNLNLLVTLTGLHQSADIRFVLVHSVHCSNFHVAQGELELQLYRLFILYYVIKAEVFESVWMFADGTPDGPWTNIASFEKLFSKLWANRFSQLLQNDLQLMHFFFPWLAPL